jgi:hypothetical protein
MDIQERFPCITLSSLFFLPFNYSHRGGIAQSKAVSALIFVTGQMRVQRSASSSSLPRVGLCFSAFGLRSVGWARVGGGVPMAWRAAAFTAEAARNGLGFRGLDGIGFLRFSFHLSTITDITFRRFLFAFPEVLAASGLRAVVTFLHT